MRHLNRNVGGGGIELDDVRSQRLLSRLSRHTRTAMCCAWGHVLTTVSHEAINTEYYKLRFRFFAQITRITIRIHVASSYVQIVNRVPCSLSRKRPDTFIKVRRCSCTVSPKFEFCRQILVKFPRENPSRWSQGVTHRRTGGRDEVNVRF